MATQFSLSGSTPSTQKTWSGLLAPLFGTKPTTSTQAPIPVSPTQTYSNPTTSSMVGSTSGLLQQHSPTTPVKSITDSGGNVVTFHTPETIPPDDPRNKYNTATGQLNPNYKDPNAPVVSQQTQNQQVNPNTGVNANGSTTPGLYNPPNQGTTGVSQGGLIGNAVNMSQKPSQAYIDAVSKYNAVAGQLEALKQQEAKQTSDINQSGTWTSRALGEQGQANIQNAATEAALSGQLQSLGNVIGQANTQQGLQQSALGTAINANTPFQVSPGNTVVSPSSNQGLYGLGTSNGGNAYQNFSNLQFNTQQGQALGKQASDLQTAANQTDQNFQTLSKLAGGINLSDYPDVNALNQAIQSRLGGNAGAVSAFHEAYNALQTSLSGIISSGTSGLTPTQITSLTNNQAITALSPQQLQTLYDTVRQTMATKINTTIAQAKMYEQGGTNSITSTLPNATSESQSLGGTTGGSTSGFGWNP